MIPVNLPSVALAVQAAELGMMNRKKAVVEPEYDRSMAIAGWLVASLVLWGLLLLMLF
jgi:hypothetical protein